jgi:hypothetical protein
MLSAMSDEPVSERIQFLMTPSLRRAVTTWRRSNGIDSEGEALRLLVQAGLDGKKREAQPTD